MGAEAVCTAKSGGRVSTGKALLETHELVFRGDFRVVLKFSDLTAVEADGGTLRLLTSTEALELDLGSQATQWREKILNPKSLMDKLGAKPGMNVSVVDVDDASFLADLAKAGVEFDTNGPVDLLFYGADSGEALARIGELKDRLTPRGGIWVVAAKGKAATVKDYDVIAAGRSAGLVDVKVAAFSSTHTALKFVRPSPSSRRR